MYKSMCSSCCLQFHLCCSVLLCVAAISWATSTYSMYKSMCNSFYVQFYLCCSVLLCVAATSWDCSNRTLQKKLLCNSACVQFYLCCSLLQVAHELLQNVLYTYVYVYMQLYLFSILSVLQCFAASLWALCESKYKCMCISLGAILPVYVCMHSLHICIHVIYTDVQVACNVSSCTCVCSSVPVVTPTLSLFFSDHLIDALASTIHSSNK